MSVCVSDGKLGQYTLCPVHTLGSLTGELVVRWRVRREEEGREAGWWKNRVNSPQCIHVNVTAVPGLSETLVHTHLTYVSTHTHELLHTNLKFPTIHLKVVSQT